MLACLYMITRVFKLARENSYIRSCSFFFRIAVIYSIASILYIAPASKMVLAENTSWEC